MVAFVFVMTRAGRVMRGARERAREANARAIADGGVTQLHARGGRARRSPESGGVCPWTNENERNLAAWESPKVPASLEKIRLQTMTKSGRQRVARRGCVSPSAMPSFFGWPRKPPADPYGKVAELAKLTCETPPFGTVGPDAELVRALKQEVRRDENAMGRVHDVLCKALAHKECGPRSHAVSVFDILFHRSVVFRSLALVSLDVFLHLGVGTDGDNHPLPGRQQKRDSSLTKPWRR